MLPTHEQLTRLCNQIRVQCQELHHPEQTILSSNNSKLHSLEQDTNDTESCSSKCSVSTTALINTKLITQSQLEAPAGADGLDQSEQTLVTFTVNSGVAPLVVLHHFSPHMIIAEIGRKKGSDNFDSEEGKIYLFAIYLSKIVY